MNPGLLGWERRVLPPRPPGQPFHLPSLFVSLPPRVRGTRRHSFPAWTTNKNDHDGGHPAFSPKASLSECVWFPRVSSPWPGAGVPLTCAPRPRESRPAAQVCAIRPSELVASTTSRALSVCCTRHGSTARGRRPRATGSQFPLPQPHASEN